MKIDKLIAKIKGNSEYSFENNYSSKELAITFWYRGWQLVRGIIAKILYLKAKGLVFKGTKATIRHSYNFKAGKNLILGDYVFIDALSKNGIVFGDNVTIERNSMLVCTGVIANQGEGIRIGNNTGINANCFLGGQGGIEIAENVIIGPYVKIFSENHNFQNKDRIIKEQGETRGKVIIGSNSWIGASVTILSGVKIGSGVVVAAGSVVTKDFEDNMIIGGTPAKIIKPR